MITVTSQKLDLSKENFHGKKMAHGRGDGIP
jgi:hypothetical protein